ncbi:MAG TPA: choice-of-anchor Q domain-containing protein [Vicinamibacterales bacterium]|nr:choice-of-anchor Q domain-containing protein [Vicinamibacterales bacterium]
MTAVRAACAKRYSLTFQSGLSGTIALVSGSPYIQIGDALNIQGPGAATLTIRGGGHASVLLVSKPSSSTPINVRIAGLTITNGRQSSGFLGAGIFVEGENVTLEDMVLSGNSGAAGGLEASVSGGVEPPFSANTITIRRSTFDSNSASVEGAGASVYAVPVLIEDSRFLNNTTQRHGGGARLIATNVTVTRSTFSGNTALQDGGGLMVTLNSFSSVGHVSRSTFSGNSARNGGGLATFMGLEPGPQLTLENSTVSNNTATLQGGGLYLDSIGQSANNIVRFATVSHNTAAGPGGGVSGDAGRVRFENSIVSDNTSSSGDLGGTPTFETRYSLIGSTTAPTTNAGGSLFNVDPALGSLQNNGGSTLTRLIGDASPARDSADFGYAGTPATDQRGLARLENSRVDMGAVELPAPTAPPPPPPPPTPTPTPTPSSQPPTITSVSSQTIAEDSAVTVSFTVADPDTPVANLVVTATATDTGLVPSAGLTHAGSSASRTLTVTPAANRSGATTVTVTVSDGSLTAQTSFTLTVTAVNDAPTITAISNQSIVAGTTLGPIAFSVTDVETDPGALTVTASAADATLVASSGLTLGGSGGSRTLTITPAAGRGGMTNVTVIVSDGSTTASTIFELVISAQPLPAAPTALTASTSGPVVTLRWTGPVSGPAVNGYVLEIDTASTTTRQTSALGHVLTTQVTLPPGSYVIRVRSVAASGTGPASTEVTVTITDQTGAGGPFGLTAIVTGTGVTLDWRAPVSGPP